MSNFPPNILLQLDSIHRNNSAMLNWYRQYWNQARHQSLITVPGSSKQQQRSAVEKHVTHTRGKYPAF